MHACTKKVNSYIAIYSYKVHSCNCERGRHSLDGLGTRLGIHTRTYMRLKNNCGQLLLLAWSQLLYHTGLHESEASGRKKKTRESRKYRKGVQRWDGEAHNYYDVVAQLHCHWMSNTCSDISIMFTTASVDSVYICYNPQTWNTIILFRCLNRLRKQPIVSMENNDYM